MDFYVDVSPSPVPSAFYSSPAPAGRSPYESNSSTCTTRFLTIDYPGLDFLVPIENKTEQVAAGARQTDPTPFSAQIDRKSTLISPERFAQHKDNEIKKIAEDRIKILALKYASSEISTEMMARLEILNSKITDRLPRVSSDQIIFLEDSINAISEIESSRLARAKKWGLKI